ncbi:MerR family transcriptional regulator [Streptomyces sp. NPDC059853]|uniref:helix-turn-helix domain-containing protein n=1 Tax=Streptomyces sp. NPDC059853 TaxID=3346973 RepID=UPI0036587B5A
MNDTELYPIGDVARRTGLSVTAVRYYDDAGIVPATEVTEAGHRLYDVTAIARLELVRTLRELDTGLDGIRQLLDGQTDLHGLLAAHLEIVERQSRALRARRAVLRTLLKQNGTADRAALLHRLASLSDEERERIIDTFWTEVVTDLDLTPGHADRLRTARPALPEDPTTAQLEAWLELADLVQDEEFRRAVRTELRDTYGTPEGRFTTTAPVQHFIHEKGAPIMERLLAEHRAGTPADAPHVQELIDAFVQAVPWDLAPQPDGSRRARLARLYSQYERLREAAQQEGADHPFAANPAHDRYLSLVAVINGTPPADTGTDGPPPFTWLAAALSASADGPGGAAEAAG